jgi:3-hydroxyisobutyrate dehydrogenase-like beta-hydroxyacid dehydrogenase
MKNPTLGLIGVGLMGHGIASNLVKHGHTLVVLEHPGNQPLDALRAAGARTAATPAELARQVDVLFCASQAHPRLRRSCKAPMAPCRRCVPGLW